MEMVVILIWKMRQDRLFHTSRAQIQATVSSHKDGDREAVQKAYDDLRDSFFPYNKSEKDMETQQMRETMMREIARGPLRVTITERPMDQRKMATKLARGNAALEQRAALLREGALEKMDPTTRIRQKLRRAL